MLRRSRSCAVVVVGITCLLLVVAAGVTVVWLIGLYGGVPSPLPVDSLVPRPNLDFASADGHAVVLSLHGAVRTLAIAWELTA